MTETEKSYLRSSTLGGIALKGDCKWLELSSSYPGANCPLACKPYRSMVLDKVLRLEEGSHASLVYRTGGEVMSDTANGVVLFGMSPGNPFFKESVIEDYVRFLAQEKRHVMVVVPQQPAEHTYRAMGSKDAVKRAKRNSTPLRTHCRRAIEKVSNSAAKFHFVDWALEVEQHPTYVTLLETVVNFYHVNEQFRSDVASLTARVIGKKTINPGGSEESLSSSGSKLEDDESIKEGVYYQLKELAFILASKEIYSAEKVSVIYHRGWCVYEKYVNGEYDSRPKEGYGIAVIAYHDEVSDLRRRTAFGS